MAKETFCESEKRSIEKLEKISLPNSFKRVGVILFIILLVYILSAKIFGIENSETLKYVLKRGLLIALLIITLSREEIEDEMIRSIRAKAFTMAFVVGAIYTLIQPLINYIANVLTGKEQDILEDLGDFQILWFMLFMYIVFFHILKRKQ
ncbi:hypothetical protein [uncultured Kordia sp.]|uniref:hypothetical protein n=1 Tax=uncultured Kordia sp. TaxID=507699 RepID=UPI00262C6180|nr:hypothetical protein [uncultured Kordia sp.]